MSQEEIAKQSENERANKEGSMDEEFNGAEFINYVAAASAQ